jgi:hypothetical protein
MRGDIDGDGKITENDRNRINEHLGGTITLTGADSWCAKVIGNNEISVSDLVQLMQYLEGKTNNLTGIPTFADYYNNWTYHKVDDLTGYWTAEVAINELKTTSDAIVNISNDEGIFYKSELTDGAIRFYATRPPIAEVPATITFKSGTSVITTSYESAKFHAATHSKDGADPITPTAIGAVGYNMAQSLTDAQKTQARGNIGAAPDGYGIGSSVGKPIMDANKAVLGGFYYWGSGSKNTPFDYGAMIVIPRSTSGISKPDVTQIASQEPGDLNPQTSIAVRKSTNNGDGAWGEWEWFNPPMQLGVEYRTTERYLDKPVYCQVIDCGVITAHTQKIVDKSIPVLDVLSCEGIIHTNANGHNQATPFDYSTDGTKYSVTVSAEAYKQSEEDRLSIYVNSSWAVTGSVHAIVRYTKETD